MILKNTTKVATKDIVNLEQMRKGLTQRKIKNIMEQNWHRYKNLMLKLKVRYSINRSMRGGFQANNCKFQEYGRRNYES